MKNTSAKGTRFERELLHFLNSKGYSVMRAPSSGGWLSPVDIVAMKSGRILAIECKNHAKKPKLEERSIQSFKAWCQRAGATGLLAWQPPGPGSEWKFLRMEDAEAKKYGDENWFDINVFIRVFCE